MVQATANHVHCLKYDGKSYKHAVDELRRDLAKGSVVQFAAALKSHGIQLQTTLSKKVEVFPSEKTKLVAESLEIYK